MLLFSNNHLSAAAVHSGLFRIRLCSGPDRVSLLKSNESILGSGPASVSDLFSDTAVLKEVQTQSYQPGQKLLLKRLRVFFRICFCKLIDKESGIRFQYICTLKPNTPSPLPPLRDLRASLIESAFILLAKLPSFSLFIVMVTLPHLAGESAHTQTHTLILLPIQLLWKGLGGAAPHVFYSPIVLAVSLQLASSVCVSLSRAGASSCRHHFIQLI